MSKELTEEEIYALIYGSPTSSVSSVEEEEDDNDDEVAVEDEDNQKQEDNNNEESQALDSYSQYQEQDDFNDLAAIELQEKNNKKAGFRPQGYGSIPAPLSNNSVDKNKEESNSGEEIYFTCSEGKITSEGIFINKKVKDEVIAVHSHTDFVKPEAVYTAIDAEEDETKVYVKVNFSTGDNRVRTLILPQQESTNFREKGKLAAAGFSVPANHVQSTLLKMFNKAKKALDDKFRMEGYVKWGWDKTYRYHIRPGHPKYIGEIIPVHSKAGTKERQYEILRKACKESRLAALAMSVALTGYMVEIVFKETTSHLFCIFGEPHRGKTIIQMLCAAIQGMPKFGDSNNYMSYESTKATLERRFAYHTHGPVILEEIDNLFHANVQEAVELLMTISNGGGKSRIINQRSQSFNWHVACMMNMNSKAWGLFKGHNKEKALKSRLTAVDVDNLFINTFTSKQSANFYLEEIQQNYGHMYDDVIDYCIKNREQISKDYKLTKADLEGDKTLKNLQDDPRNSDFFAQCYRGAEALGHILGDKDIELIAKEAIEHLIHEYKPELDDESESSDNGISDKRLKAVNIYDNFKQFIYMHSGQFKWKGYAFDLGPNGQISEAIQKSKAQELNNISARSTLPFGLVNQDRAMFEEEDFSGDILLTDAGYNNFCKSCKISKDEFLSSLKYLDLLKTPEKNRDNVRLSKKQAEELKESRSYRIILTEVSVLAESEFTQKPDIKVDEAKADNNNIAELEKFLQ